MKIGMVSLGCPKNLVDSEVMLGLAQQAGHELTQDPASADVLVVNTCAFIDSAKKESIDAILEMAQHKTEGACQRLIVTGCLAERYREQYRVELERCVGVGDQVVVGFRASRETRDQDDPRPLQSRRKFSVERYYAVVTIRNGRVAEVRDFPHLDAAFAAAGIDPEES